MVDPGEDRFRLIGVGVALGLGGACGVGCGDGEGVELDEEIIDDRERAFLSAQRGGFFLEAGESAVNGEFGGVEFVGRDESGGVVGGAVDAFACGESLEGLGDVGLVLTEAADPEGEVGEAIDGHGGDIGRK